MVAGRYSLTAQQETQAKETAESLLNSLSVADLQKALAVRLVAVGAGPLVAAGLLGRGELDGTLRGADAADP